MTLLKRKREKTTNKCYFIIFSKIKQTFRKQNFCHSKLYLFIKPEMYLINILFIIFETILLKLDT